MEALGNVRCTGAEIVIVGPQTGRKVAHYPRTLKVCCKRTSFGVGHKVDGRRNFQPVPHQWNGDGWQCRHGQQLTDPLSYWTGLVLVLTRQSFLLHSSVDGLAKVKGATFHFRVRKGEADGLDSCFLKVDEKRATVRSHPASPNSVTNASRMAVNSST